MRPKNWIPVGVQQSMILDKLWASLLQKGNLTHFGTFWLVLASSKRLINVQSDPKCIEGIFRLFLATFRGPIRLQWLLTHSVSIHHFWFHAHIPKISCQKSKLTFFHCITCLTHIGTFWLFLATFRGPIRPQWLPTHSVSIHHF